MHYYWLVTSDVTLPLRYAAVVGVLLGYRVLAYVFSRRSGKPSGGHAANQSAASA